MNCIDEILSQYEINKRSEKSSCEVDLVVKDEDTMKTVKILNITEIDEQRVLKFSENNSLLLDCCSNLVYPTQMQFFGCNTIVVERKYYENDLEEIIQSQTLSSDSINSIICGLCNILIIMNENDVVVGNLKSSNVVYVENRDIKLCDIGLNTLRKEEEMTIYDICFKSPEELIGLECNERSVIWSVGCILYEIINKKLPFNEDNNMNKTKENIVRCKNSLDEKCDDLMKEMIKRMLKVKNEDRLNLIELKKEMIKMSEIKRDGNNYLMIYKERKEMLNNNDFLIIVLPILFPSKYYLGSHKWEVIRDDLIELYTYGGNERILAILLMIKLYKKDDNAKDMLLFRITHKCKKGKKINLDKQVFNMYLDDYDEETIRINSDCFCMCEKGMNYLFKVLKYLDVTKIGFDNIEIPLQLQSLFGLCFTQLRNPEVLDLIGYNLTYRFIESFVISIPFMKLRCLDIECNPIGPKGFKLLLPYLHLLLNGYNKLNLCMMNLNDESMILLSSELHKYPNLEKIDITENKNIHSKGLKALFSKLPISKIEFDFNRSKELLLDKDIPELIKYTKDCRNDFYMPKLIRLITYYYVLDLNDSDIDDDIFKSFIKLRSNECGDIRILDLSNNKLTYKSIEILVNSLSSFSNLKELQLYGNEIGDEGIKILSPHLHLLKDHNEKMNCSNMGLSSIGLKYLLDSLKNIQGKIELFDISYNCIDADGVEYLMNYMKDNNIEKIIIHDNPIGNNGFKLLLNNLDIIEDKNDEINMNNILIDDKSAVLLPNKIYKVKGYITINLNGNDIRMKGLKALEEKYSVYDRIIIESIPAYYLFVQINNSLWTNEEFDCYLSYCYKQTKRRVYRNYDFSNLNVTDSHILFIKQLNYKKLDLSNNRISNKGLKELIDSIPKYSDRCISISINNNPIGDEGIEIICKNLDKFVNNSSLNVSNIGMSEKGLKILIERLRDYQPLKKIDISGWDLNDSEMRMMKENNRLFENLDELSISLENNINKYELEEFFDVFCSIGRIKILVAKKKVNIDYKTLSFVLLLLLLLIYVMY